MRHDVVIIGGSFAGLSAAIPIARARRSVCVIDSGAPRNRFAEASHGFFGHDGSSPLPMISAARAQLAAYPTVTSIHAEAISARQAEDGFAVDLGSGRSVEGAKLILAFGVSDVLPELPGLAKRWGKSVLHCPYCHGFEFSGQELGVLYVAEMSVHQAMLVADWGPTTLYLDGRDSLDDTAQARLARRGVKIEPTPLIRLEGEGDSLSSVVLSDGRTRGIDALYLAPRSRLNSAIADHLGCTLDDGPFGPVIRTDADKRTTVPGVYAAGDIARAPHSATWAAADGVTAGVSLHQLLVFEPLAA